MATDGCSPVKNSRRIAFPFLGCQTLTIAGTNGCAKAFQSGQSGMYPKLWRWASSHAIAILNCGFPEALRMWVPIIIGPVLPNAVATLVDVPTSALLAAVMRSAAPSTPPRVTRSTPRANDHLASFGSLKLSANIAGAGACDVDG